MVVVAPFILAAFSSMVSQLVFTRTVTWCLVRFFKFSYKMGMSTVNQIASY